MSDRRDDFLDPEYEPGEFDLVERRLRGALHDEALQSRPRHRLDAILEEAASPTTGRPDLLDEPGVGQVHPLRRRWVVPLAAAAAVAVVAGTLWAAGRPDDRATPVPPAATSPVATPSPSPSQPPTTPATSPATPTSETPTTGATAGTVALPVYLVGETAPGKGRHRLFREFVRAEAPADATGRVGAALDLAVVAARPVAPAGAYLDVWQGVRVDDVALAGGASPSAVTVTLSGPGRTDLDADTARVAVQQLVWTAQAALGKGNVPVRFATADGSGTLLGSLPTATTYRRPASPELYYQDLAPIWVTAPARGQVLPVAKPVVVRGEATVFEANLRWQLLRDGQEVDSGFTTASEGAPGRGTWGVDLGRRPAGTYTLRAFEVSAADGTTVNAEHTVAFTVR